MGHELLNTSGLSEDERANLSLEERIYTQADHAIEGLKVEFFEENTDYVNRWELKPNEQGINGYYWDSGSMGKGMKIYKEGKEYYCMLSPLNKQLTVITFGEKDFTGIHALAKLYEVFGIEDIQPGQIDSQSSMGEV